MASARKTDPATSHEAAASVENVTATQQAILRLLKTWPMTDAELVTEYKKQIRKGKTGYPFASESGIRSRRAELVRKGLVVDTFTYAYLASGRRAIVWRAA